MNLNRTRLAVGIALCLIALAALLRVLPHPANFAPVAAVAIFGGALLPGRYAVIVPLAAMAISDLFIGWHSLIPVTWGVYALVALASNYWLRQPSLAKGAAVTLGGSLLFFVATNFAVWLSSGMYERTFQGLAYCFTLALPFFRNTLMSDVLYTAALFGMYALATATTAIIYDKKIRV